MRAHPESGAIWRSWKPHFKTVAGMPTGSIRKGSPKRSKGSEIARTEVTKALVSYIKSNNLIELGEDSKNKIAPYHQHKN